MRPIMSYFKVMSHPVTAMITLFALRLRKFVINKPLADYHAFIQLHMVVKLRCYRKGLIDVQLLLRLSITLQITLLQ